MKIFEYEVFDRLDNEISMSVGHVTSSSAEDEVRWEIEERLNARIDWRVRSSIAEQMEQMLREYGNDRNHSRG